MRVGMRRTTVAPGRDMPDSAYPTDDPGFRIVFHAAANAMLVVDDALRIRAANAATGLRLRMSVGDLEDLPLSRVTVPDPEAEESQALVRRHGRTRLRIAVPYGPEIEIGLHLIGKITDNAHLLGLEPIGLPGAGILTARQRETLRLLCDGATNQQIALALGVSDPTVQKHIVGIKERLGAATRAQVVALALQHDDLAQRVGDERIYVHQAIRDPMGRIVDSRLLYASQAAQRETPEIVPHVGHPVGRWYPRYAQSPLLALIVRAIDSTRSTYADRVLVTPPSSRPRRKIEVHVTPVGRERAMVVTRAPHAPLVRGGYRAIP